MRIDVFPLKPTRDGLAGAKQWYAGNPKRFPPKPNTKIPPEPVEGYKKTPKLSITVKKGQFTAATYPLDMS
jgi:hypothetical protein